MPGVYRCAIALCILLLSSQLPAQVDIVKFENPDQQAIYQKLIKELRCLVCQNQNLADSNAPLARDLRRKSYDMIMQGKEYDDIIQYMTDRYGEFVLYRPRVTPTTLFLWFGPFLIFISVTVFAFSRIRRSRKLKLINFSEEELNRARSLLDNNPSR